MVVVTVAAAEGVTGIIAQTEDYLLAVAALLLLLEFVVVVAAAVEAGIPVS